MLNDGPVDCVACEEQIRSVRQEDQLFTDTGGPYCEICYEHLTLAATQMLLALKYALGVTEKARWPISCDSTAVLAHKAMQEAIWKAEGIK